jgi:hypothetical protein
MKVCSPPSAGAWTAILVGIIVALGVSNGWW